MAIDDGRGAAGRPVAPLRFSASDAAFTGLRLLTREPRTWLIWGALFLAFSIALGALMVTTAGPALMQMSALRTSTPPDPTAAFTLMARLAPFYAVTVVLSLVFYAVAFAGVNRAVLRPDAPGLAHLALGGDELRQFIVLVLLGLVLFGVYIAALIGGVIVGVGVAFAGAAAHIGGGVAAGGGLVALIFVLVGLVVLGAVAFVMTRLSLASPLALDTGRIDLSASWRMTRGRFWALFGAYVLAWLVTMVLFVAAGVLFAVVAVATGGGLKAAGLLFRPDMSSLQGYFAPLQILWLVLNAALAPLFFALGLGAPAGAYAQLRGLVTPTAPGAAVPRPAPDPAPDPACRASAAEPGGTPLAPQAAGVSGRGGRWAGWTRRARRCGTDRRSRARPGAPLGRPWRSAPRAGRRCSSQVARACRPTPPRRSPGPGSSSSS